MKNQLAVAMSIINKVKLPHIPNEVARLQDESLKPEPDVVVVAECIGRNPKLLTKFLAVASLMSKKEVTTARQAVTILGTKGVFTVFFSSAIEFTFQATGDSALIVNHAIKIATAMAELSWRCKGITSSDAYLFGLLYNVGYIVLNTYDPKSYKACYLTSLMTPSQSQAKELEAYGTTSSYIGVYVAKKWRVKNSIYSGILFQQDNVKKCPKGENLAYEMINLLSIARAIVAETEEARYITEEVRSNAASSMKRLNIGNTDYTRAQRRVKQFTKDLESFSEDFMEEDVLT
ncbi:hypothetical protein MNBD_GAMMA04-689 [hydrothermal vent metagenome]|uniref:HDOD domain-containing protein n=1 Tax=hydrothermal vent metagenome TaxID=652676 RepID=A0A3B0VXN4_9ZZZZ